MSKKSSTTTKNRRKATERAVKTADLKKAEKAKAKAADSNTVVERRLGRLSDAQRAKAATDFEKGMSIPALVEKYGFRRHSNARYTVRQHLVSKGKVAKIDPTDVKALAKALAEDGPHSDRAWVACRAGISGGELNRLVPRA